MAVESFGLEQKRRGGGEEEGKNFTAHWYELIVENLFSGCQEKD
jgi:hypothetical protein